VEDNGCGFNPDEVFARQDQLSGFGLKSMQERSEICGGVLNLTPSRTRGTSVRVALPIGTAASGFFSGCAFSTPVPSLSTGKTICGYWRVLHALGRMHA